MSPLYDYECQECGREEERFSHLANKDLQKCSECGGMLQSLISQSAEPVCFDYFCTSSMKRYTGPAQRERELRKKHYSIL